MLWLVSGHLQRLRGLVLGLALVHLQRLRGYELEDFEEEVTHWQVAAWLGLGSGLGLG